MEVTRRYKHSSQTYSPSSHLQSQKCRRLPWGGSLHPLSQQPLYPFRPIQARRMQWVDPFQRLLKLQDSIPTSQKVIPRLSPSISTDTAPILVKRTISPPVGDPSPASINVTRQSYHSLVLYTIPPIEISTKSPTRGNFHPRSPPPPQLFWSNEDPKH